MKTLTKLGLITAVVLSLAGCFGEDDKSYTEEVIVAPLAAETVIAEVTCEGFHYKVVSFEPRPKENTYKVLTEDGLLYTLPVNQCTIQWK